MEKNIVFLYPEMIMCSFYSIGELCEVGFARIE